MKRFVALSVVLAVSVAAAPVSRAQSGSMKGMDVKDMDMKGMQSDKKAQSKVHKGEGTVTKIDSAGGKVTISHGPIQSMKWPAMSMDFNVRGPKLLTGVKPNQQVKFEFVEDKGLYVITSIK